MQRRKKIILLIIIMIVIFTSMSLNAEDELTLGDVIQLAQENNVMFTNSKLDVEKANNDLNIAIRSFLPNISFQSTYTRMKEGMLSPTGDYLTIPTGETIPVVGSTPDQIIDLPIFMTIPEMETGSANMFNTQISIQQPIFAGGKVFMGIDLAKMGVSLAEIQEFQTKNDLFFSIIQGYFNLFQAEKMVEIQNTALKLLEEHERIVRVNYQAGLVLQTDILQVEIEKSKTLEGQQIAKNNLYLAKKRISQMIGLNHINFSINRSELYPEIERDLVLLYQQALNFRPELQNLRVNQEMLKTNLEIEKRNYWPNLMLLGSYNWQGEELTFKDGSWNISLSLSAQLFDGGVSKKKQKGLNIQLEKLNQSKENIIQMIELELEEALLKIEEAEKSITLQELTLKSAKENLRIAKKSYEVGVGSNLDVLNAQSILEQVQISKIQAEIQYQMSLFKLLYKAGLLVDYCEEVILDEN